MMNTTTAQSWLQMEIISKCMSGGEHFEQLLWATVNCAQVQVTTSALTVKFHTC